MKTQQSSPEFDERCFAANTGWFVWAPQSRNAEVAKYLRIPYVYCVGQYPGKTRDPEVVFIQPSRALDARTNKVNYLVVTDFVDICEIVDIMKRTYNEEEARTLDEELNRSMELARQGLL